MLLLLVSLGGTSIHISYLQTSGIQEYRRYNDLSWGVWTTS